MAEPDGETPLDPDEREGLRLRHITLVEVERFEGEPPPVTAFEPPRFVRRGAQRRHFPVT